ncbi:hypothetical protein QJS10_CPB22g00396 [Acorus calamus]|uniref:Endonuclease/exonuclease/phosphatase domain-containing protein n=1 Tax=Acorus calamus TaxID=4465 RepID=A0AAV9C145_ACOCL|nr:hypothetical protein QJS10_CPB22g00396 [Acorus calamus]
MEIMTLETIRAVGGGTMDTFVAKPSIGMSGGILTSRDSRKWEEVDRAVGEFSFSVLLECQQSEGKWVSSNVYGPHEDGPRERLWEEMSASRTMWNSPWLVVGDFNVTRFPEDHNRPGQITPGMAGFSSWIDGEGLIDIPTRNQAFTWSNLQEVPSLARLDRILLDAEWEVQFPRCEVVALPHMVSDHVPLLLTGGGESYTPSRFCYEAWWSSIEGFNEVVTNSWSQEAGNLQGAHRLAFKLKRLCGCLRVWARDARIGQNERKCTATETIKRLDAEEEARGLSVAERMEWQRAKVAGRWN